MPRLIPAVKLLTGVFWVMLALAACSTEAAVDPLEIGDPEIGEELLTSQDRLRCHSCHTVDGGTYRPGPTLLGISAVASDRVPELSAVDYLRQSLLDPKAFIVEGFADLPTYEQMPAYTLAEPDENGRMELATLTEEELNHLIAFLLTLNGGE